MRAVYFLLWIVALEYAFASSSDSADVSTTSSASDSSDSSDSESDSSEMMMSTEDDSSSDSDSSGSDSDSDDSDSSSSISDTTRAPTAQPTAEPTMEPTMEPTADSGESDGTTTTTTTTLVPDGGFAEENSGNSNSGGNVQERSDNGDHGAINLVSVEDKWNGVPYLAWTILVLVALIAVMANSIWCYWNHRKNVAKKAAHSAVTSIDLDIEEGDVEKEQEDSVHTPIVETV